jgi:hypothetical protein
MPGGNPAKSALSGWCTQEGRAACLKSGTNNSGTGQKTSGRECSSASPAASRAGEVGSGVAQNGLLRAVQRKAASEQNPKTGR